MSQEANEKKLMPFERLLQLGEGKREVLLEVNLELKHSLSFEAIVNKDYEMIVNPFTTAILECLKESVNVVDIERLIESLERQKGKLPYAYIDLSIDGDGVGIGSRFYHIEEKELMTKGVTLYKKLDVTLLKMSELTNHWLDEYAELKDSGQLYTPREFVLFFRNDNQQKWEYDSFSRKADRLISLQKVEIANLLDKGVIDTLLQTIHADQFLEKSNQLIVKFHSDGFCLEGIEIATR